MIVYSDMPWGKTRADLLARINGMNNDGKFADIVSARDETDREGARFVVELRPGADPAHVDRVLKSNTDLRTVYRSLLHPAGQARRRPSSNTG